jgi:glycerophosphoryl diester phosphodiesterase
MNAGLVTRSLSDLRREWRAALGFHFLMQLLALAVFTPAAAWIGRRLVLASGEPVVSNYDIAGFVLSPAGVAFVLVAAAIAIGLLLAEFAGYTWIAGHALARREISVIATVAFVLARLPVLMALSVRVFLRLVLLALPFLAVAGLIWFTMLAGRDINYYLAESPPGWLIAKLIAAVLAAGYVLLAAWQLARWLYAVPALMYERLAPAQALSRSETLARDRVGRIVLPVMAWWVLLTALALAITWACRQLSDAGLDWAGIDVCRVLPLVAVYVAVSLVGGFVFGGLGLAGHQFLVTRMYAEQVDPDRVRALAGRESIDDRSRSVAGAAVLLVVGLFVLAVASAGFLASRLDLHEDVAITAHRGASGAAPENSMAAFRAAMEAGATYVELDVQRTRDGDIVVLHDGDLLRMGGDPRKVGDMTAAELASIDIGRRYGPQFAGERPPMLAEVIDLVRGRVRINVELKYNVPDPALAPAVIDLLKRENFLDQVVITSLDYAALKQVRSIEPGVPTGHIVTAAVGDVLRTEADFLSLSSAQASASLVRRAHLAGKQIHVWTVNDPEVMLRMVERGVDNIITDDPALAARVMRDRAALTNAEILGLRLRVLFARPPPQLTDPAAVEAL